MKKVISYIVCATALLTFQNARAEEGGLLSRTWSSIKELSHSAYKKIADLFSSRPTEVPACCVKDEVKADEVEAALETPAVAEALVAAADTSEVESDTSVEIPVSNEDFSVTLPEQSVNITDEISQETTEIVDDVVTAAEETLEDVEKDFEATFDLSEPVVEEKALFPEMDKEDTFE